MSATLLQSSARAAARPAPPADAARPSRRARRAGLALGGVAALFLAGDMAGKFVAPEAVVAGTEALGYGAHHLPVLGLIQLACLVLYLVPRTAPLGAVLWTGYLGGAVATHLRLGNPLLTHTLFPVYVGALLWAGLALRDARLRALLRPAR
jgi:hypothetical protein